MESNAIQLLMHATWTQIAHKQLVKECIIAFGNFAFDNDAGVKAMVQQGVIKLVEKVLQTYPDQNRLMELQAETRLTVYRLRLVFMYFEKKCEFKNFY